MSSYSLSSSTPWASYLSSIKKVIISSGITNVGKFSFANSNVVIVTLSSSVTVVDESAFAECKSLTSVDLSTGVSTIKGGAFIGCTNLSSITFPSSLRYIYHNAFSECSSLTSIRIPSGFSRFYSYAFSGCTSLTTVYCEKTSEPIYDSATNCGCGASSTQTNCGPFSCATQVTTVYVPSDYSGSRSSFCGKSDVTFYDM